MFNNFFILGQKSWNQFGVPVVLKGFPVVPREQQKAPRFGRSKHDKLPSFIDRYPYYFSNSLGAVFFSFTSWVPIVSDNGHWPDSHPLDTQMGPPSCPCLIQYYSWGLCVICQFLLTQRTLELWWVAWYGS